MKIFKFGLRIWFTIASLFSFLVGWIFFAHSQKPAPLQVTQPAVSAPLPSFTTRTFDDRRSGGFPTFSTRQQAPTFSPRLRTGGS